MPLLRDATGFLDVVDANKGIIYKVANKGMYNCYQNLSGKYLGKLTALDQDRMIRSPRDQQLFSDVIWEFVSVDQDSIMENRVLPLAKLIRQRWPADSSTVLSSILAETFALRKSQTTRS